MTKTENSLCTVDTDLVEEFEQAIESYARLLLKSLDGDTLFGVSVMPSKNVMDVFEEFVTRSTEILIKEGHGKVRARSVSRHVFEKSMDEKMSEIN